MKKIYAILDLPTPILCDGEVLGKTVNIKLGNFTGKIHFPVAKKREDNSDWYLQFKVKFDVLKKYSGWGDITSYSETQIYIIRISKLLIEFDCDNCQDRKITNQLYKDIDIWLENIINYFIITTTYVINHTNHITCNYSQCVWLCDENKEYISKDSQYSLILGPTHQKSDCLSLNQFNKISQISSQNKELLLEYSFYCSALQLFWNGEYRKAIIEVSTALEICVTKILEAEEKSYTKINWRNINKTPLTLGRKLNRLKDLSVKLPTYDYEDKIVSKRNKAVHKGIIFDKEEAKVVIQEVKKYLDEFSPLDL